MTVVHCRVRGRGRYLWRLSQLARVGDLAVERRRSGRCGGAEVDLVAWCSATAREVAVEGPDRGLAADRGLTDSDAGAADGLEHPRAGGDEVPVEP